MGVTNAVTIDAEGLAPITLVGPGAGGIGDGVRRGSDIADIAAGCARRRSDGRPRA